MWTYRATVVRVVDGDTVDLDVDLGFRVHHDIRVRLLGVDTPEVYGVSHDSAEYAAGVIASETTRSLLPVGASVVVRTEKTGKYGRWLADITADGVSVNDALREKGYTAS